MSEERQSQTESETFKLVCLLVITFGDYRLQYSERSDNSDTVLAMQSQTK